MLKRGYTGTYHHISPKHLHRYVDEFAGRHNMRPLDTADQMRQVVVQFAGKRLPYRELVARCARRVRARKDEALSGEDRHDEARSGVAGTTERDSAMPGLARPGVGRKMNDITKQYWPLLQLQKVWQKSS